LAGPAVEPTAKAVRDDGLGYGLFEAACEISVLREPATRGVRRRATGPESLGLISGAMGRPRSDRLATAGGDDVAVLVAPTATRLSSVASRLEGRA
jgi:hypothetical protein